jgi:hypothetical protein
MRLLLDEINRSQVIGVEHRDFEFFALVRVRDDRVVPRDGLGDKRECLKFDLLRSISKFCAVVWFNATPRCPGIGFVFVEEALYVCEIEYPGLVTLIWYPAPAGAPRTLAAPAPSVSVVKSTAGETPELKTRTDALETGWSASFVTRNESVPPGTACSTPFGGETRVAIVIERIPWRDCQETVTLAAL